MMLSAACISFLMEGVSGENWVLLWWAGSCSVKLESIYLLMGGVVAPSLLVVWPGCLASSGIYELYGRVNGDLQESLYQGTSSRTAVTSARIPAVSPC